MKFKLMGKSLAVYAFGAGLILNLGLSSAANADVVRIGPRGNTSTTTRTYEEGSGVTRTTTGSGGNSATTTHTYEDGDGVTRTRIGPGENSTTTTTTVEDGRLIRTRIGPSGNSATTTTTVDIDD